MRPFFLQLGTLKDTALSALTAHVLRWFSRGRSPPPLGVFGGRLGENWGYPPGLRTGKFGQEKVFSRGRHALGNRPVKGVTSSSCVENTGFVLAPQVGLEPTTLRLTAECSTIELLRSNTGGRSLLHQTAAVRVNGTTLGKAPDHSFPTTIPVVASTNT